MNERINERMNECENKERKKERKKWRLDGFVKKMNVSGSVCVCVSKEIMISDNFFQTMRYTVWTKVNA